MRHVMIGEISGKGGHGDVPYQLQLVCRLRRQVLPAL